VANVATAFKKFLYWTTPAGVQDGLKAQNFPRALADSDAVSVAMAKLSASVQQRNLAIQNTTNRSYHSAVRVTWIVIGAGLAFALLLAFVVSGLLVRPLRKTQKELERVAGGDLTGRVDVTTRDEVGHMAASLNTTIETVHDVVKQLSEDTARLSELAHEAIEKSTSADEKERASNLADMAENLDAMISIFTLREDEAAPVAEPTVADEKLAA